MYSHNLHSLKKKLRANVASSPYPAGFRETKKHEGLVWVCSIDLKGKTGTELFQRQRFMGIVVENMRPLDCSLLNKVQLRRNTVSEVLN